MTTGDIEVLELIAKDRQEFILRQGWAVVSIDGERELIELPALEKRAQHQRLFRISLRGRNEFRGPRGPLEKRRRA